MNYFARNVAVLCFIFLIYIQTCVNEAQKSREIDEYHEKLFEEAFAKLDKISFNSAKDYNIFIDDNPDLVKIFNSIHTKTREYAEKNNLL